MTEAWTCDPNTDFGQCTPHSPLRVALAEMMAVFIKHLCKTVGPAFEYPEAGMSCWAGFLLLWQSKSQYSLT